MYWVANGASAAAANAAANWNTVAGSTSGGTQGVPATGDTVVFGDSVSIAANLGFAPCRWDLTTALAEVYVNDAYGDSVSLNTNGATFVNTGSKLTLTDSQVWNDYDFYVGMGIGISGSVSNDGVYEIATIGTGSSDTTITFTTSVTDETIGGGVSITVASVERGITMTHDMNITDTSSGLRLSCILDAASAKTVSFSQAFITSSAYNSASYDGRYILNGKNASFPNIGNITYSISGTASGSGNRIHFDNGPHPIVNTGASAVTYFSPQYKTPTSDTFLTCTFHKLQITGTTTDLMAPIANVNAAANDSKKIFHILAGTTDQLDYNPNTWDAGISTWGLTAKSGGFEIPVSGSTTYGNGSPSTFIAKWHGIEILPTVTAGDYCSIASGKKLYCNNLTIGPNTLFKGAILGGAANDTIQMVKKPIIFGSWNFHQVAEGIYHSNPTLNNEYYENVTVGQDLSIGDKLTVTGEVEIDGALNHDGSTLGFYGKAPASKTTVAVVGAQVITPDLPANPNAADAPSTTTAINNIQATLDALITALRSYGLCD